MVRKSASEIALIRESARWCEHAHRLLQEYTRPGATEAEASLQRGPRGHARDAAGARRCFGGRRARPTACRPAIGVRSACAARGRTPSLTTSSSSRATCSSPRRAAPIWGYHAELERAMIIGPPSDEARRLFDHAVAAQQVAFAALRPGVTCADVDGAVMRYLEQNDLLSYWRQHTGHAIGLRNHEAPFLDLGDHTPIEAGMVFTIEPGVYADDIGGFRHSDTIVVTPDGFEKLTDYPIDIESLTIPVKSLTAPRRAVPAAGVDRASPAGTSCDRRAASARRAAARRG